MVKNRLRHLREERELHAEVVWKKQGEQVVENENKERERTEEEEREKMPP